ncbi:MAG: hypothetical protein AAF415_15930 [Pseudomonadota bacterium]
MYRGPSSSRSFQQRLQELIGEARLNGVSVIALKAIMIAEAEILPEPSDVST